MAVFNKILLAASVMGIGASLTFGGELSLEQCREAAARGEAEALWQLGQRYEKGQGVRKNPLRAVSQYRKAAEKLHAKACARLAELYEKGIIVGRDSVQAARYRAMSEGQNGVEAAVRAEANEARAVKRDPIEDALDYILGRNGKPRDAKAGIRLLYGEAKDNPTAQRVFVERWEKGDLDDGLAMLDVAEWALVLPWFKKQYDAGRHKGGLVLGNEAYRQKRYSEAESFWRASGKAGVAKAWFRLGEFYWLDEKNGGAPKWMQTDMKARTAFERCLETDSSYVQANLYIGDICLFGNKYVVNYSRAMNIFSSALYSKPDDPYHLWRYGLAGVRYEDEQFDKKWPKSRFDYLVREYKSKYRSARVDSDYRRMYEDWKWMRERQQKYVQSIEKASRLGCEPAQKFMANWHVKN